MSNFSIKDIEAVSGIKCHTLRIWEQRYGVIKPKRTCTNIRYYDDEDLKYILNISILNKQGYKISEIAKMSGEEVNKAILKLSLNSCANDCQVKSLVAAMLAFDEYAFNQILTTNVIQFGLEYTMLNIVFPFLNEAGLLWQVGSACLVHEHFATNIIKQKLYVAIDGNVGRYSEKRKKFLLFLPKNEKHPIELLFVNYVLRSRGQDVLCLGQQVVCDELERASINYKPDYVFTILTAAHVNCHKEKLIKKLITIWPDSVLLCAGIRCLSENIVYPDNVKLMQNMNELIGFIDYTVKEVN